MNPSKKTRAKRTTTLKSAGGEHSVANNRLLKFAIFAVLALTAVVLAAHLIFKAYKKGIALRDEQSVVNEELTRRISGLTAGGSQAATAEETKQIQITPSQHFTEEHIRKTFGLTNGCNLAAINFVEKREMALKTYPLLRNIKISRIHPDKVKIAVEERKPVARINIVHPKDNQGRPFWMVVDSEGVVFDYSLKDSRSLPKIIESKPSAQGGEKISGKTMIALRLVELSSDKDLAGVMTLTEVDVSNDIFLIARTREDNKIKILWEYVREKGDYDLTNMRDAIYRIRDVIKTDLKTGYYQTLIVTDNERVVASPNEKEYIR